MVASAISVAALVLGGCSPHTDLVAPATSAPSAAPSATTGLAFTVVGHLDVEYIKVAQSATLPQQPITYKLVVVKAGSTADTEFPVDADGNFAFALSPGIYDIPLLEITAADSEYSLKIPMSNTEVLRFNVPATGCVYPGQVHIRFGRLPAGTEDQQVATMRKIVQSAGHNMMYGYLPSGGIVVMGGETSIAPAGTRPAAAKDCSVEEFTSVPR